MYTSGKASSSQVSMSWFHCMCQLSHSYIHKYNLRQPSKWHAAIFCGHGLAVRKLVQLASNMDDKLKTDRLYYNSL